MAILTSNTGFLKKALWSVDAFAEPGSLWQQTLQSVEALVERNPSLQVQPIFILSPEQLNLSLEFGNPWIMQYRPAAQKALDKLFAQIRIKRVLKPKLITLERSSNLQVVKAISSFAVEMGADLIIASTHGRSGFKRLLMGSFAETLLLQSRVPVWLVSERMKRKPDFTHILFPTDFSPTARAAFRRTVAFAQALGSRLTLFHAIPHPVDPVLQSGVFLLGGGWVPIQTYFGNEIEHRTRHAEGWAKWSRKQGVETEVIVDPEATSVPDRILSLAKKRRSSLIVMEAESGPVASALVGSITRQVLRHADCPVLVIRARSLGKGAASRLPRAA